jgi:hypothetical protein
MSVGSVAGRLVEGEWCLIGRFGWLGWCVLGVWIGLSKSGGCKSGFLLFRMSILFRVSIRPTSERDVDGLLLSILEGRHRQHAGAQIDVGHDLGGVNSRRGDQISVN